ncbi:hypothetical protein [Acinetobacter sp. WCHAc010034]|nr:hypothetical protein [Acinetobacter sp. WCHAc010034]
MRNNLRGCRGPNGEIIRRIIIRLTFAFSTFMLGYLDKIFKRV